MKISVESALRIHDILKEAEVKILNETGVSVAVKVSPLFTAFRKASEKMIRWNSDYGSLLSVQRISFCVADALGVSVESLISSSRHAEAKEARQIVMYLCKKYLKELSQRYIGEMFNRDRTTVIHSLEFVSNMVSSGDKQFNSKLDKAEQAVKSLIDEIKNNTHKD